MKSVLFKMDSVPVALLVMVPTATGFYLSILFSRSQVLYRGNCNSLCAKHMFLSLLGFSFRGKFAYVLLYFRRKVLRNYILQA